MLAEHAETQGFGSAGVPIYSHQEVKKETYLQRLFSAFPGGWPGIALLLLRAVFAAALLVQGGYYLHESEATPATWILGIGGVAAGCLFLIGLFTPVVGSIVGLAGIAVGCSLFPPCTRILLDSYPALVFAASILLAVIMLGPGAFSVDARLFGRREIIIPRR